MSAAPSRRHPLRLARRAYPSCVISEVDPTAGELAKVARPLHLRNEIDGQIAAIIQRLVAAGHLGEWIASAVFDIELEPSATTAATDGRFRVGKLQGKTVNIKWYLKRETLLDMTEADVLDYYLVMTGPAAPAASSRGGVRPWRIDSVSLRRPPAPGRPASPQCQDRHRLQRPPESVAGRGGVPESPPTRSSHCPRRR